MDTDMGTELDGRLLARQALAIAIALSTRSNPQATDMALELLGDLKAHMHAPSDSPSRCRPAVAGRTSWTASPGWCAPSRRRPSPARPTPRSRRLRAARRGSGSGPGLRPLRSMRGSEAPQPLPSGRLTRQYRLRNSAATGSKPSGRAGARFSSSAPQRLARSAGTQGLKRSSPLISTRGRSGRRRASARGLGGRPGHSLTGPPKARMAGACRASASARESK